MVNTSFVWLTSFSQSLVRLCAARVNYWLQPHYLNRCQHNGLVACRYAVERLLLVQR